MNPTHKKLVPTGQPYARRHALPDGGTKITTFVPLQFKKRGLRKVVVGPEGGVKKSASRAGRPLAARGVAGDRPGTRGKPPPRPRS